MTKTTKKMKSQETTVTPMVEGEEEDVRLLWWLGPP